MNGDEQKRIENDFEFSLNFILFWQIFVLFSVTFYHRICLRIELIRLCVFAGRLSAQSANDTSLFPARRATEQNECFSENDSAIVERKVLERIKRFH